MRSHHNQFFFTGDNIKKRQFLCRACVSVFKGVAFDEAWLTTNYSIVNAVG